MPLGLPEMKAHAANMPAKTAMAANRPPSSTILMRYHSKMEQADRRPAGIVIVGVFAVIAGLGEVVVGFTGNYLGILAHSINPSFAAGLTGAFYGLGGLSFLVTRRKWGAALGMLFIGAEIAGRIYLMATGIAAASGTDATKILIGGSIALALIIYVASHWKSFK
jgi:hypothetical protein